MQTFPVQQAAKKNWGKSSDLSASLPLMIAAVEDACHAVSLSPAYHKAWARARWVAIDITPALELPRAALVASKMVAVCARALAVQPDQCDVRAKDLDRHVKELLEVIAPTDCKTEENSTPGVSACDHIAVRSSSGETLLITSVKLNHMLTRTRPACLFSGR